MEATRRCLIAAGALLALSGGGACSNQGDPAAGAGGQADAAAQGGMGVATGGATGAGGSSDGAAGRWDTAMGDSSDDGAAADGAAGGFANVGVCGQRGKATADATSFNGYEEVFIIGDSGFGSDVCAVRFDFKRVGDAPAGCTVCTWTHLLEYSNPQVVTDAGGTCAASDLALDAVAIATIVGSRVGIGFAKELGGAHGSARMRYFEGKNAWDVYGNATWDETTSAFKYDNREGLCSYGP